LGETSAADFLSDPDPISLSILICRLASRERNDLPTPHLLK
jgi:hypothetical protein